MSEPTLISPLLDGFTMGQPMGEHDGVSCCPAIREDKKYIVKIITIPPSQTQLDALLLAGAYKDPADAMDYYRQVSEGVLKEAEFLKKLSQLDGFLSYEGWQLVPITRGRLGYQVYLVGSYKRTLEKHLRKNPVTHLEAINLGLDLCAALTVCRQAGSLYVALKPGNIFVSDKKQYRIGDLGFIPLNELSYTALPKKYQSRYTPPELFDPMEPLNLTADTYAVGMILYQLYNDGQLPHRDKTPEEGFPSPINADYELAEIILKALNPDPKARWSSPADLGKALAAYMQRNAVNDTPITPHKPLEDAAIAALGETVTEPPKPEDTVPEAEPADQSSTEASPAEPEPDSPVEEPAQADIPQEPEIGPEAAADESEMDVPQEPEGEPAEEPPSAEAPEPESEPESETAAPEEPQPILPLDQPLTYDAVMKLDVDSLEGLMEEPEAKEPTAPAQPPKDDFPGILDKAEDLIHHEAPKGVVLPETGETADPFAFAKDDTELLDDEDIPRDPLMPENTPKAPAKKAEKKYADSKYKRRAKKLIGTLTFLLALSMAGLAGFWYYQNIYLQAIEKILISGTRDQLTVTVDTQIKDSMLTVTCSDSHGNSSRQPLSGGTAIFSDLSPSTVYTIQLDVSGFHKLTGKTSDVFTTDATTNILSFTSVGGTKDGSVVLNFTVEGDEPSRWTVHYEAEGEEAKEITFEGHSVEITNLTVGKMYTFTLDAGNALTLGGQKSIQLMGSRLILADNLRVSANSDSEITLTWDAPGDVVVDSWNVRCYGDKGYDERQTVTDTHATFVGMDPSSSYTLEIVASGMTKPVRTGITVNPIRVESLTVQDTDARKLTASWEFAGNAPKGGWLLLYTIDGGGQSVVKSDKATADITPRIPGAKYSLTLQAANGTSVLGGTQTYTCPAVADFDQFGFSVHSLQADLLVTPEGTWRAEDIDSADFATSFSLGDSISVALRSTESFYLPGTEVEVLYAVRDSYGNVLSDYTSTQKLYWKNIWNGGSSQAGELTLPKVPDQAGSYVLDLYIEGMQLAKLPFTIG